MAGLTLSLVLILVVGYVVVFERYQITDIFEERLSSIPFNGIVAVEVIDGPEDGLFAAANEVEWQVRVVDHLYDRGAYASVSAGRAMVDQPLPTVDSSVVVSIPKVYELDLGATYILVVSRARAEPGSPQANWPWQSRLVLDQDGALHNSVPDSVAKDVAALRLDGESDLDVALALFSERADTLDASVLGDVDEIPGERLAVLAGADIEQSRRVPEGYESLSPQERQLPGELADAVPGAKEALGIDEWASWRVIITYDDAAAADQWFALLVDEYGFIGPIELSKDQNVTELHAFGPGQGTVSALMLWPFGVPSFAVPDGAGAVQLVDHRLVPIDDALNFGAQERSVLDDGGAVHVSLEDGRHAGYRHFAQRGQGDGACPCASIR